VVFHCRRSSHLFYTSNVFSQSQTRVKLNHFELLSEFPFELGTYTGLDLGISSLASLFFLDLTDPRGMSASVNDMVSHGISTYLKRHIYVYVHIYTPDALPRVTTASVCLFFPIQESVQKYILFREKQNNNNKARHGIISILSVYKTRDSPVPGRLATRLLILAVIYRLIYYTAHVILS